MTSVAHQMGWSERDPSREAGRHEVANLPGGLLWPDALPDLRTDHLELSVLSLEDAADVAEMFSDPEVTRFMGLDTMTEPAQGEAAIEEVLSAHAGHRAMRWGIRLRQSPRLVGTVGFLNVSDQHRRAELGYDLGRPYWGVGLVREATAAAISYGFGTVGLHRVEADVHPDNHASIRVLERLGFRYEGMLRDYLFLKDQFQSIRRYGLLREDFRPSG